MIKKLFFSFLMLAIGFTAFAQTSNNTNTWQTLAKITYKKQYDEMMGFKVDVPVFSPEVTALAGQEVVVRGYIIPVEDYGGQTEFVFSAFPYNMCFFCGGAGPETVLKVSAIEEIPYTAEAITIRGVLALNDSDLNELMYSMTNVTQVDEDE